MSLLKNGIYNNSVTTYTVVVCIGYSIDLIIYMLLTAGGVNLLLAYIASFLIGGTANVLLLRRFFAPGQFPIIKDVILSLSANGVIIIVGLIVFSLLVYWAAIPHLLAKVLSNVVSFIANYFTRRTFF